MHGTGFELGECVQRAAQLTDLARFASWKLSERKFIKPVLASAPRENTHLTASEVRETTLAVSTPLLRARRAAPLTLTVHHASHGLLTVASGAAGAAAAAAQRSLTADAGSTGEHDPPHGI